MEAYRFRLESTHQDKWIVVTWRLVAGTGSVAEMEVSLPTGSIKYDPSSAVVVGKVIFLWAVSSKRGRLVRSLEKHTCPAPTWIRVPETDSRTV